MPVRLTEFSITEEAFDTALNPIRAKVSTAMRVLTVDDLGFDDRGGLLYLIYQQGKGAWPRSPAQPRPRRPRAWPPEVRQER